MATEFKLSFTGSEINDKLGKIDRLAEKSELPTKISDLTNDSDFATKEYIDNAVSNAAPTPNWNASKGENGYIENRTHWSENGEVILVDGEYMGEPIAHDLVVGQSYHITYNGVKSDKIAKNQEFNGMMIVVLGNAVAFGGEDTGEAYCFYSMAGIGTLLTLLDDNPAESVPLKLSTTMEIVHKLPVKYLSDEITPYYLTVLEANFEGTFEYNTTVSVTELEALIDSGRQVIVKVNRESSGNGMCYMCLFTDDTTVDGKRTFGFSGAGYGLKLTPQDDGFYIGEFGPIIGGSSASIDVTASVGQTIVVEEVDANGKPTKWKAAEYQEKICGIKEVVVFPETTITDGFYELPAALPLVENVEYAVSLDGTKYIGVFKRGEDPTSLYFDCDDFPNVSPVQYYEIPDSIRFIQTNGQTILSITEMGVEPIATKYVENALPYYIEVLNDGYLETPNFHISETVEKLVPILESGRDVILRIEDYDFGYPVFTICRLAKIFNDNYDMHSARLMFKDSWKDIRYHLQPQDNGTYSIEIMDTQ